MADIKQAAKWMQEGLAVRRASWRESNPNLALGTIPAEWLYAKPPSGYGDGCDCVVNAKIATRISFSTLALLADDWEISQ